MIGEIDGSNAGFAIGCVPEMANFVRRLSGDQAAAADAARDLMDRAGMMSVMPAIPEPARTSLAQRLRAHATANWPRLTAVHVRYRGQFAYVDGELAGGERLPLMRLRYGVSARRWGTAIYVASTDS